jgi:hypothetical protein
MKRRLEKQDVLQSNVNTRRRHPRPHRGNPVSPIQAFRSPQFPNHYAEDCWLCLSVCLVTRQHTAAGAVTGLDGSGSRSRCPFGATNFSHLHSFRRTSSPLGPVGSFTGDRATGACSCSLISINAVLNPLKPSGYCTYRQQFYVLPTQCVYVFCVDLRTNSDYFPIQH